MQNFFWNLLSVTCDSVDVAPTCTLFISIVSIIMAALTVAISQRKILRASITRIFNDKSNFASYAHDIRNELKLKLENAENELSVINEKVLSLQFSTAPVDEAKLNEELLKCDEYKDRIFSCKSLLLSLATTIQPQNEGAATAGYHGNALRSMLKSPTAPLPRFCSNIGENLELFFYSFEETLSKFNYTQYDRLLLLKQQISGKASLLIESLEPEKQTYDEAKRLLVAALASPDIQKFNTIKQLSELKLTNNGEPFQYIADVRKTMQAIKSLKIDMNDIMQYFFSTV